MFDYFIRIFSRKITTSTSIDSILLYLLAIYFFLILSECELHCNSVFWIFGATEFFLLYRLKHLVRNNGLMGVGVEIPIHEAIILYLGTTYADGLLEEYPSRVFFVGQQFADSPSILFRFSSGGKNTIFLQAGCNCS